MTYIIRNVRNHAIGKFYYFFDAHVWVYKLKPKAKPSGHETMYSKLFDNIVGNDETTIVVSPILLSEVINICLKMDFLTYVHNRVPKIIFNTALHEKNYYKEVYRNTQEYENSYLDLLDDITQYKSKFVLSENHFGRPTIDDYLNYPGNRLDYNDYLYSKVFEKSEVKFITHDIDFLVEGIEILTYNQKLIDKPYIVKPPSS